VGGHGHASASTEVAAAVAAVAVASAKVAATASEAVAAAAAAGQHNSEGQAVGSTWVGYPKLIFCCNVRFGRGCLDQLLFWKKKHLGSLLVEK